jgi:hypothetical protein
MLKVYNIITQNGFFMFTLNVTTIYLAPKNVNVSSDVKCFDIVIQKLSFMYKSHDLLLQK